MLKASTGERILHFIEPDDRAAGNPQRQVLFMRPGVALEPGTRYIVAMRNLKDESNNDVVAEVVFESLRDSIATTIPAIEKRRVAAAVIRVEGEDSQCDELIALR